MARSTLPVRRARLALARRHRFASVCSRTRLWDGFESCAAPVENLIVVAVRRADAIRMVVTPARVAM